MKATPLTFHSNPLAPAMEKLLWLGGRFLHLIPGEARLRVPFGINRGRLWLRGSANAPEWLGTYEYRKQRILPSIINPGTTVCDIGANAGFYTLALSRLVGSHGRVIAFEPYPRNVDKIRRHLVLNKIDNVIVSACALCEKNGRVPFAAGDSDFTGRISAADGNTFEVPATTLDEFIAQNEIDDPTVLKIDVEGAEADVLTGARELIGRTHPKMLIALHGPRAAVACYSILRQAGYTLTALNGTEIDDVEKMPFDILAVYRGATLKRGVACRLRNGFKTILYRLGIAMLQRTACTFLAPSLDAFCRIWQRHEKLRTHLRSLNFDGVVDGGANVGEFAAIVRHVLPKADLVCVEPQPASAAILRREGYKVVEAALWSESTRLQLHQPTATSTSCSVLGEIHPGENVPTWQVPAVRLDSLDISGNRLLIKLDLQGAEPEAVAGMGSLWQRCAGVLLEVSIGPNGNYEWLDQMLAEHGFREYSTTNELIVDGQVVEADKLWIRR